MKTAREYSAGGVVTRGKKILLIRMRTLSGDRVWTFPKGHLEPGETPRQAALREVTEETGYECEVRAPLSLVRYSFFRSRRKVSKRVRWYWMEAGRQVGSPDPVEICGMKWLTFEKAKEILHHRADFRLLDKVRGLCA